MATDSDVIQAVYDECVSVIGARSDVSDADAHVTVEQSDLPENPPAVSLSYRTREEDDRRWNDTVVVEWVRNASDEVVDFVYAEESLMRFDVTALATSDVTAVDVYESLKRQFNTYDRINDPSGLAPLVTEIRTENGSPTSEDDRFGHILTIEVEYETHYSYSDVTGTQISPVRSVEQHVALNTEADPSTLGANAIYGEGIYAEGIYGTVNHTTS